MTCAPSLLKFLGTKLSLAITKPKAFAEQRLFQAILVQALEDATNPSNFKREPTINMTATVGLLIIQKIFNRFVGELT